MEEGLSSYHIAILKKEYAPFKNKTITAARAKQLMNILDKFKEDDLKKLGRENIPFVSSGARTKLMMRNMKFKVTTTGIKPFREEVTQEDFDLEEGKMKTIATMFSQGKSAEEIAKAMKLPVNTVKNILGENAPTDADMQRMKKLGMKPKKEELDEKIQPYMLSYSDRFGKHAGFEDAKTLQDLQNKAANLRKKGFKIDKMGRYNPPVKEDKDAFDPITEACWTGYKQVGMKKKGGKMVPNCVPEDFKVEDYINESTDINFNKRGAPVSYLKRFGRFSPDMKQYRMNGVNMTFWVWQGDDYPGSGAKFDRNKVFQLKLTSAYRPSNDKEYDKMYDVINKWGSERRLGKLNDKDVDIYFESVNEQDDSMTMAKDMKKKKEELPKNDDVSTTADTEKKEKKEGDNVDKLKADIDKKDAEIQSLKTKAETDKAKAVKKDTEKMVNPETGEPLLQVGVAYKHLRDKMKKDMQKEDVDYLKPKLNPSQIANIKKTWQDKKPGDVTPAVKQMIKKMDIPTQLAIKHANIKFLSGLVEADLTKPQIKMVHKKADELPKKDFKDRYGKDGDSVRYAVATNIVKKKQGIGEMKTDNKDHPAKNVYEQIKGLKNKAEKSGMPYSILKKVYDRGMAAWRGGHRPGTSQQQWAFARVNSFVTKSSGTWGGADKDLAKQVRGSK